MVEVVPHPNTGPSLPPIEGITPTGPSYAGSVQVLHPVRYKGMPEAGLIAQATDGGSVFDVGTFFAIEGSGEARNTLRHRTFNEMADPVTWNAIDIEDVLGCFSNPMRVGELLASPTLARLRARGMPTHHVGLIDRDSGRVITGATDVSSDLVLIKKFPVIKPARTVLLHTIGYDYRDYTLADRKIMALEHLVRLGNPGGSSLQDRYNRLIAAGDEGGAQRFLSAYGLQGPLEPWARLPDTAIDWTTKYEADDRHLSIQEAMHISGVSAAILNQAVDVLSFSTIYANGYFARRGLQLWDMKWELAVDGDNLVLADTLDHDSMRITAAVEYEPGTLCYVHFNKQAMRDHLRIVYPDWHAALIECKQRAQQVNNRWTFLELYQQGVRDGRYPEVPSIDPAFTALQSRKYRFVTEGGNSSADASRTASELCLAEIEYYRGKGLLDEFIKRNAVRLERK